MSKIVKKRLSQADQSQFELFESSLAKHQPRAQPPQPPGLTIPASNWFAAQKAWIYRIPNRGAPKVLLNEDNSLACLLINCVARMLHVCMCYHRAHDTHLTGFTDSELWHFTSFEALVRTVDELRNHSLHSSGRAPLWDKSVILQDVKKQVYGIHAKPGHDKWSMFHKYLPHREDLTLVTPLCSAYNSFIQYFVNYGDRVCLDEIVLHHEKCTYPSKKANAKGPEFITLGTAVPTSGLYIYLHLIGRDWEAKKGPTMLDIVREISGIIWLNNVEVGKRPCVR